MEPHYWEAAKKHLSGKDKIMAKLIANYEGEGLRRAHDDVFHTLARAIVGQQISVKAADTIWARFAKLSKISPQKTLKLKEEDLRSIGFSAQKVGYVKCVAQYCHSRVGENLKSKKLDPSFRWDDSYEDMSDDEVIAELMQIKGIGRWTAEMFLIFHLQRPNILPLADLGLVKAIEKHYGKNSKELAKKWHPYNTVATWYLWNSKSD